MPRLLRPDTPSDVETIASLTTVAFLNALHSSRTEAFVVNAQSRGAGARRTEGPA